MNHWLARLMDPLRSDYLFNLTDPEYLDPGEDNALVKLPDGIPLGATGSEDTVIVSLHHSCLIQSLISIILLNCNFTREQWQDALKLSFMFS